MFEFQLTTQLTFKIFSCVIDVRNENKSIYGGKKKEKLLLGKKKIVGKINTFERKKLTWIKGNASK